MPVAALLPTLHTPWLAPFTIHYVSAQDFREVFSYYFYYIRRDVNVRDSIPFSVWVILRFHRRMWLYEPLFGFEKIYNER